MPPAQKEANGLEEEAKFAESKVSMEPAAPAIKVEEGGQVTAAPGEIKKLNEQVSQLRQENIVLKEEILRLKRIVAASDKPHHTLYGNYVDPKNLNKA